MANGPEVVVAHERDELANKGLDDTFQIPKWGITQLAAREIEISYAGGCEAVMAHSSVDHHMTDIRPIDRIGLGGSLEGVGNVFILTTYAPDI